jgi:sugar/nucleoside kinase (ribokinase family)
VTTHGGEIGAAAGPADDDAADEPADPNDRSLLFGALSLDIHLPDGPILPGGGALNMAWHLHQQGVPFRLLTRVGDDRPRLFLDLLDRQAIPYLRGSIVGSGPSASIDITIQPDRQPYMDHFVDGVWADLRLTAEESAAVAGARQLHAVLVEGVIAEMERQAAGGALEHLDVSADFLGFRHYTPERFADTMRFVDLGFVGWPGEPDDPIVAELSAIARRLGKRLVVTFGARSILVIDGRIGAPDTTVPVTPVEVRGTTVGCGDAFIAWFLAEYWRSGDLVAAAEHGRIGGALATAWERPLPDEVYETG